MYLSLVYLVLIITALIGGFLFMEVYMRGFYDYDNKMGRRAERAAKARLSGS